MGTFNSSHVGKRLQTADKCQAISLAMNSTAVVSFRRNSVFVDYAQVGWGQVCLPGFPLSCSTAWSRSASSLGALQRMYACMHACSMHACMHACMHTQVERSRALHCAVVRCDLVLHQAFRMRHLRNKDFGGEVRHGVTSGVSRKTSVSLHRF